MAARPAALIALLGSLAALSLPSAVDASTHNYCGTTWSDANSKCQTHCPGGQDSECPAGETCYADCTNCPADGNGPTPPSPTPPTGPPPSPSPGVTNAGGNDSRMVAFLGNWQACPTDAQLAQYTHIMISFAVSYTWAANQNSCSTSCTIGSPVPICNDQNRQDLVDSWRAQGKKVLVSFGGAGMGGSWANDPNDCWEYCFGKEASVVSQLVNIVNAQNFDGVDIDYEYFYEDNGDYTTGTYVNNKAAGGAAARNFLSTITSELKANLPAGQNMVTHAPMDSDMVAGSSYYNVLVNNAANLDFLLPQYYNGIVNPTLGYSSGGGSAHYTNLVNNMFNGDATKVVWGFCISDCSGTGTNMDAAASYNLMTDLKTQYNCHGGAFFWVVEHDTNGAWSSVVNGAIQPSAGCSGGSPGPGPSPTPPSPTNAPVKSPTNAPVKSPPTAAPVKSPTNAPPPPAPTPANCPAVDNSGSTGGCGPNNPCADTNACCSQWGWCNTGADYCDPARCCQHNCWGSNPTPTNAPVKSPTNAPVKSPTNAPVKSPTNAPVKSPTSAPVKSPTNAPVKSPTNAPVKSPTNAPVAPTAAPVKSPTNAPVKSPTNAPVKAPTNAPVIPTAAPVKSPTNAPVPAPTAALAADGDPCSVDADCQSGSCSGGNPANRECLSSGGGGGGGVCLSSGASCSSGSQCCLGVCKGGSTCK